MITGLLARLAPATWVRAPRPTARLRLTALYGTLFLLFGAALLGVTYVLAGQATAINVPSGKAAGTPANAHSGCIGSGCPRTTGRPGARDPANHVVRLTPSQGAHLQAEVTHLHDVAMHHLLLRSGMALAATAIISIALGWLVAGRVLAPVRMINAAARRITASNLHERLSLDGPDDEFRELAATLDDLLERLQAAFDSQRRFVANASHELRTPLTLDRALLERALLKPQPSQAVWRATCERLLVSSKQQDRLIEALLTLARSDAGLSRHEPCELGAIIDNVLLGPELNATDTTVRIQTNTGPAPVTGDPRLLERLVRNLIDNAIRHNIPGGKIDVTTQLRDGHGVLTVTNTGPVLPAAEVERLLEPFQRAGTDRTVHDGGLGLGLSIVQAICAAHQANLTLIAQPQGGLRVEVSFPAPTRPELRPPPRATPTQQLAPPAGARG